MHGEDCCAAGDFAVPLRWLSVPLVSLVQLELD